MIYLCAAPKELSPARQAFAHIAHAACHIDRNSRLLTSLSQECANEDLLLLTGDPQSSFSHPDGLCRAIKELCLKSGLQGIAVDLLPPASENTFRFLSHLQQMCSSAGFDLFVPEDFTSHLPEATAVVCTAMSGGIFTKRLEEAIDRFGRGHIALDIQRLMMDFPIPAPDGIGTPLSHTEFKELFVSLRPAVFFSRELCAKYFLCRRHGQLHLILFDDLSTLLEKIRIGKSMGISHFFFSYPEISDILGALSLAVSKEKTL